MYRESNRVSMMSNRGGDQSDRRMMQTVVMEDTTPQHPGLNWAKLITLILSTFGLIVAIWFLSQAIEHMKKNSSGIKTVNASYVDAGGLLFGLFCAYVIAVGVAWYCGAQKRDQIRRDVVQKQIARQRALQALNNLE